MYQSLAGYFDLETYYLPKYWDFAPSISGTFRGRYLRIFSFDVVREQDDGTCSVVTYTTVHVRCDNPLNYSLTVGRSSSLKRAWKTIKGMFIEEDPIDSNELEVFFEKFHLDANEDHFGRTLLEQGLMKELMIFEEDIKSNIVLDKENVFYTEPCILRDDYTVNRIRNIANLAILLAELTENYHNTGPAEFTDL